MNEYLTKLIILLDGFSNDFSFICSKVGSKSVEKKNTDPTWQKFPDPQQNKIQTVLKHNSWK